MISYVVFYVSPDGDTCSELFDGNDGLQMMLTFTKTIREAGARFVCSAAENPNQVGKLGVDAVVNGILPDGSKYDWSKAHRAGKMKRSDFLKISKK